MSRLDRPQSLQEAEFCHPYHYIAQFKGGAFKHFMLDSWAINYASTMDFLLNRLDGKDFGRVVDIGCGDGRFSREIAFAFRESEVVGIDYSTRAIALATAMNPDIQNLEFKALDITQEHALRTFDAAILMEVFEHIPLEEADRFMAGVRALLNNRGALYVTVPHENKPLEYKHFQHFTVDRLTKYLNPYFDVVEVIPFERISWQRNLVKKLLNNKYFVLNHPRLLKLIYRLYKQNLFFCSSEAQCQRIFIKALAK